MIAVVGIVCICNCNICYTLWVFVSESWMFVSEKAISKIFTLSLLHICIQREKDQCCVLFVGIFYAGMPGSNLGSCHSPPQMERLGVKANENINLLEEKKLNLR